MLRNSPAHSGFIIRFVIKRGKRRFILLRFNHNNRICSTEKNWLLLKYTAHETKDEILVKTQKYDTFMRRREFILS